MRSRVGFLGFKGTIVQLYRYGRFLLGTPIALELVPGASLASVVVAVLRLLQCVSAILRQQMRKPLMDGLVRFSLRIAVCQCMHVAHWCAELTRHLRLTTPNVIGRS